MAPNRVDIWAVTASGPSEAVAVGGSEDHDGRLIVARSSDAGRSWEVLSPQAPAMVNVAWTGERLLASRYCLPPVAGATPQAAAPSSCLFASDDRGSTWSDLHAGTLTDPTFADPRHGWAHSPFPSEPAAMSTTEDGGVTWTPQASPCDSQVPLIAAAVNTEIGAGFVLCVGRADAEGQSWALVEVTADGKTVVRHRGRQNVKGPPTGLDDDAVQGFTMRANGSGLFWTTEGLYRTSDRGTSWQAVGVDDPRGGSFWGGGVIVSDTSAYLVQRNGGAFTAIFGTTDGMAWHRLVTWPFFGGPAESGPSIQP